MTMKKLEFQWLNETLNFVIESILADRFALQNSHEHKARKLLIINT